MDALVNAEQIGADTSPHLPTVYTTVNVYATPPTWETVAADIGGGVVGLESAEALAQQALKKKPCAQMYGNAKSWARGFTPQNVLKGIVSGDKFGNVVAQNAGPVDWVADTSPPGAALHPLRLIGFAKTVTMKINTYNAIGYWPQLSTAERAETLLHELGHAFNFMSHNTGPFKVSNLAELKDKYAFDKEVQKNCF